MRINSQEFEKNATIITLGGTDINVGFNGDMTLAEAFAREGISVGDAQTVWVGPKKIESEDFDKALLDDGDEIQIIGKKEGGNL